MRRITVPAVTVLALALVASPVALGHGTHADDREPRTRASQAPGLLGRSTLEQRITGGDRAQGFSFLRTIPGEPHLVRRDLAPAHAGRERRRRSLVYLTQLTDFQLVDEESPARVEFFDLDPTGFASSAWRPQEAFLTHAVDWSIRQTNRFVRSPVRQGDGTRARMLNAVLTGDLADNMQRNETEWVVRLLEGGELDPNSGTDRLEGTACPPGTPLDDPRNYTGVQDYDDYLLDAPMFYDPEQPTGPYAGWPRYPGLMDRAQAPFVAEGLRVPSYVAFGNHDALLQGNEDAIQAYEAAATGCVKPAAPLAEPADRFSTLNPELLRAQMADPTKTMLVPPDERRQFVDKVQFKRLHATQRQADQHGFGFVDPAELAASNGAASYYAWSPRPGLRYIVLDTLSEGGVVAESSNGNLDDPQFRWLERELQAAAGRDEIVVAFGHHARGSLSANVPDELASPCTVADEHGHDVNPGCDRDPRASTPLHLGDDLEALFHRHPHVVAYVAGHSHENRVEPSPAPAGGEFWEIKSPAIIDWPPQHRLIEIMDNCDGTLSIFGTMLDHAAPVRAPGGDTPAGQFDPATLASVGRTLTWNDPQQKPEETEGQPRDRNVELLIRDPRRRAAGAGTLRVTVSPRRVSVGRRTRIRVRVTTRGGAPVRGATVRLAGRRATTTRGGQATIVVQPRSTGRLAARAFRREACSRVTGSSRVRVTRRAAVSPRFTG